MCFTIDQIDRACGLLLLNDFNRFVYCCKHCQYEFDSGSCLEVHILSEHHDDKEAVFVNDNIFTDILELAPTEFGPTNVKTEKSEPNTELSVAEPSEVKPMTILIDHECLNSGQSSSVAPNRVADVSIEEISIQSTQVNEVENFGHSSSEASHQQKHSHPPGFERAKIEHDKPMRSCERPAGMKNMKTNSDESVKDLVPQQEIDQPNESITSELDPTRFHCDLCPNVSFKLKQSLLRHMIARHVRPPKPRCEICNVIPRKGFDHHMRIYHPAIAKKKNATNDESVKDLVPQQEIERPSESTEHDETRFYCDLCPNVSFKFKQSLHRHIIARHEHNDRTKPRCEICNIIPRKGFDHHMRWCRPGGAKKKKATNDDTVKDLVPQQEIERPSESTAPEHDQTRFYCEICPNVSFKLKQSLLRHMNAWHVDPSKRRCEICNIKPRKGYDHHMRTCHSDKPYKCDVCDAKFKHHAGQVNHMRSHTGETPFLCSTCGKAFTSRSAYHAHERRVHRMIKKRVAHGMVKKHPCLQCDKSFTQRYSLQDHVDAIHLKLRPYVCDMCGKDFTRKKALQIHKDSHDGPKYQCQYCDVMFTTKIARRNHEVVYHEEVIMINGKIMNKYKKKDRQQIEMLKEKAQPVACKANVPYEEKS